MMRPCGNSIASSSTEGPGSTVSTPVSPAPLVYGRGRGTHQYDFHLAIRPSPSGAPVTWRDDFVLPCDNDLPDCFDGPPVSGRSGRIIRRLPTHLRSTDEGVKGLTT